MYAPGLCEEASRRDVRLVTAKRDVERKTPVHNRLVLKQLQTDRPAAYDRLSVSVGSHAIPRRLCDGYHFLRLAYYTGAVERAAAQIHARGVDDRELAG